MSMKIDTLNYPLRIPKNECKICDRPKCNGWMHNEQRPYIYPVCYECGIEFNELEALIMDKTKRNVVACEICDKIYEYRKERHSHILSHFYRSIERFESKFHCLECADETEKKLMLANNKQYILTKNFKIKKTKKNTSHYDEDDENDEEDIDEDVYIDEDESNSNESHQTDHPNLLHQCTLCNKEFDSSDNLAKHIKNKHNKIDVIVSNNIKSELDNDMELDHQQDQQHNGIDETLNDNENNVEYLIENIDYNNSNNINDENDIIEYSPAYVLDSDTVTEFNETNRNNIIINFIYEDDEANVSNSNKNLSDDNIEYVDSEAEVDNCNDDTDVDNDELEIIEDDDENVEEQDHDDNDVDDDDDDDDDHNVYYAGIDNILLKCKICYIDFFTLDEKQLHFKRQHPPLTAANDPPKNCPFCDEIVFLQYQLKQHISDKHIDSSTGKFKCPECDKTFRLQSQLLHHFVCHTKYPQFLCHICGNQFKRIKNLDTHMKTHDPSIREYLCDLCPKTFSGKSGLTYHMRSHTGETPFKCPFCDRQFRDTSDLRRHKRVHIPTEKTIFCTICKKSFYEKKDLNMHLKIAGDHGTKIRKKRKIQKFELLAQKQHALMNSHNNNNSSIYNNDNDDNDNNSKSTNNNNNKKNINYDKTKCNKNLTNNNNNNNRNNNIRIIENTKHVNDIKVENAEIGCQEYLENGKVDITEYFQISEIE